MPFTTRRNYFSAHPSNEAGNKDTRVFNVAWARNLPDTTKLATITNDASTTILAVNANNKIIIMQSFKNLGGTLTNPVNKYTCLIGSGCNAVAVIVDTASLLALPKVVMPAYETIISCITKEIADLVTKAAAPTNFLTMTSILPDPWLLEALLETNSNDPTTLIWAASDAAAEFDQEYKCNNEYITEAEEVFANFMRWMWAIQANHIPKTNYVVEPENEEVSNYGILCHHQHINPNPFMKPFALPPPPAFAIAPPAPGGPGATASGGQLDVLNLLKASIARQAGAMEQMNTHAANTLIFHKEKETQKKDRFVKLHQSTKQLILFTSTCIGDIVPNKLENTCTRFMNATTHGVTEHELSMQLREQGLGKMTYATGLSLNLYSGRFIYAVWDNPSNFSCFSIHEGTHLDKEEQQDRQLILHLIKTKGKRQSIEEITSLNKQQVKVPTTYTEMIEQFAGFKELMNIFFGQFSVAHQAITALTKQLEKCKSAFKAREQADQKFCCKFVYAVNTCFQLVGDCMTATMRTNVANTILNF
jgi:hypothetical protein